MSFYLKRAAVAAAVLNLCFVSGVQATNGYFSDGTGTKSRGMGGAGTALAMEAGSVVLNPAAAVNMGSRLDAAVGLFSPDPRGYTIDGNDCSAGAPAPCGGGTLDGSQESRKTGFLVPFFGMTGEIDAESSWGFTVTALGGINTDYKNNTFAAFGGTGPLGIDLKQVQLGGTYARKLNDRVSVGATLGFFVQQFEAKGLDAFAGFSTDSTKLTNNGTSTSTGIGINLGITYEVTKDITIGFAYAPETDMSEFDEYAGLFAEGGDLDIPSNYALGIAWNINKDLLFALDLRRINYTDVASISNDFQRLVDLPTSTDPTTFSCGAARLGGAANPSSEARCLGAAGGAGFGWDDMTIIKLGVAYTQNDMVYRVGWNHGESPIESEDATINIIAPAVVEDHFTLGLTKNLDATSEVSFTFIHVLQNDVTGPVPASFGSFSGPGAPTPGTAGTSTIEMEQNLIEVQYGKRF